MKVSTLDTPRVGPSSLKLTTFSVRSVRNGAAVGNALSGLGDAVTGLGLSLRKQDDKDKRFKALVDLSAFESDASAELDTMSQATPPGDTNFADRADATYGQREDSFLKKIPAELRGEFKVRTSQYRQRFNAKARTHQQTSMSQYYDASMAIEYSRQQQVVANNPDQLQKSQDAMVALTDSTSWDGLKKARFADTATRGLAGVVYKSRVKKAMVDASAGGPGSNIVGSVSDVITTAAGNYGVSAKALKTIAWLESHGNATAQNPKSTAGGLFQFIDKTASDYGLADRFDPAQAADAAARLMRDNRNGLIKVLRREPTVGELYLAHQQGLGGARQLLSNPTALAVDIVGKAAVLNNGGDSTMTAQEFANLWINKAENGVNELDSAYDGLTFDTRKQLRADAEREARGEIAQTLKEATLTRNAAFEELQQNLLDGTASQESIDMATKTANFTAKQRAQLIRMTTEKDTEAKRRLEMQGRLEAGSGYNSVTDQKLFNAWVSRDGEVKLANLDEGYVGELAQAVTIAQDIPTSAVGVLETMSKSGKDETLLFSMQALAQLEAASFDGFNRRVTGELAKRYDRYASIKNSLSLEPDKLAAFIRGGAELVDQQARPELEKQARELLGGMDITRLFGESISGSSIPTLGLTTVLEAGFGQFKAIEPRLKRAGTAAFVENYLITGDKSAAQEAMLRKLSRSWGVTELGGQGDILTEYPLESVYPPVSGSTLQVVGDYLGGTNSDYRFYDEQIRQQYKLTNGQTYELFADDLTIREIEAYRAGRLNGLPAYTVRIFDEDGNMKIADQPYVGTLPESK